jgi:hypothetical protein
MVNEYILTFEEEVDDEGNYIGVMEIANTASPAIRVSGVALSEHKPLLFADAVKYQIAAPVLIPSRIPRVDPDTKEQYFVTVTEPEIEKAFVRFMRDRAGDVVFNYEHDEAQKVPAYILETWLVDNPKQDKSYTTYGVEVPKGSWFAVAQFTDKDVYNQFVKDGVLGFSIHGNGGFKLVELSNQKTEIEMAKLELTKGQVIEVNGVKFSYDGEKLIEATEQPTTDEPTASVVFEEEEETVVVEATEEPTTDEPTAAVVMEEETVEEVEADAQVEALTEAKVMEMLAPKFAEIYDMIAELKAGDAEVQVTETVEAAEEPKVNTTLSKSMALKIAKIKALSEIANHKKQK